MQPKTALPRAWRRWSLNSALVALLASLPGAAYATNGSDDTIADAVKKELATDEALPDHVLTIRVKNGLLELQGTVTSFVAKTHAVSEAQTIPSVRAVIDRIVVRPKVALNDQQLQQAVRQALKAEAKAAAGKLTVRVKDGVLTLSGTVHSYAEKILAGSISGKVAGVRDVDNRIAVAFDTRRTDSQMAQDVIQRLRWDARVDQSSVTPEVKNAVVYLRGSVSSMEEREHVRFLSWVAGVKQVDSSKVQISSHLKTDPASEPTFSDADVYAALNDALDWDTRVDPRYVTVHVLNGKVTLRGTVTSALARRAAEQDAKLTTGVKEVHNSIEVLPAEYGDPLSPRSRSSVREERH